MVAPEDEEELGDEDEPADDELEEELLLEFEEVEVETGVAPAVVTGVGLFNKGAGEACFGTAPHPKSTTLKKTKHRKTETDFN